MWRKKKGEKPHAPFERKREKNYLEKDTERVASDENESWKATECLFKNIKYNNITTFIHINLIWPFKFRWLQWKKIAYAHISQAITHFVDIISINRNWKPSLNHLLSLRCRNIQLICHSLIHFDSLADPLSFSLARSFALIRSFICFLIWAVNDSESDEMQMALE